MQKFYSCKNFKNFTISMLDAKIIFKGDVTMLENLDPNEKVDEEENRNIEDDVISDIAGDVIGESADIAGDMLDDVIDNFFDGIFD